MCLGPGSSGAPALAPRACALALAPLARHAALLHSARAIVHRNKSTLVRACSVVTVADVMVLYVPRPVDRYFILDFLAHVAKRIAAVACQRALHKPAAAQLPTGVLDRLHKKVPLPRPRPLPIAHERDRLCHWLTALPRGG